MPTPHNAAEKGQIAPVVLMPGDPLRAKFIAERYFEDVSLFSRVRNVLGYTGTYQGAEISVMASGMGMPSMGIYAWELYKFYDVDTIIRIGSAGGLAPQVHLRDIVMAQAVSMDSSFRRNFGLPDIVSPVADFDLLRSAADVCERKGLPYHVGNIVSTDLFYTAPGVGEAWRDMGALAVEMEMGALYLCATKAHRRALGIATVSDMKLGEESLSAEERETSFTEMMEVALEVAVMRSKEL